MRINAVLLAVVLTLAVSQIGFAAGVGTPEASNAQTTPTVPATATLRPTATPRPTRTPTPTRTPRPTATPRPTRTPRPTATTRPTAAPTRTKPPVAEAKPTPAATATPHATATKVVQNSHHSRTKQRHHKSAKHASRVKTARHHSHAVKYKKPTPTPTVTPTATRIVQLQTENSIAPVTCGGRSYRNASAPFLTPPFHGWTTIVSYVDHDLPDFSDDGYVIVANGDMARISTAGEASDFPAYWNPSLRQYIYYDGHNGYDYDLYYQPVYAAAPGKVIFAAMEYPTMPAAGYGNMVMIEHRGGYVTLYGHFSKILVRKGELVKRGQQIGVSGNTGHSTGPHLHFTVFHNCTPTDPYGWTGSGIDPLTLYKGETSEWLWKKEPLVSNPLPHYPGIDQLPVPPLERVTLLTLPSTSQSPESFTAAFDREARVVEKHLGRGEAHFDSGLGALTITAPMSAARLLSLPYVASIAGPDAIPDVRRNMSEALTQTALHARPTNLYLGTWPASIMSWRGRTYLYGAGGRKKTLRLHVAIGAHVYVSKTVHTAADGAYFVDLGRLNYKQVSVLRLRLQRPIHRHRLVPAADVPARRDPPDPSPLPIAGGILALAAAVGLAAWQWMRRR